MTWGGADITIDLDVDGTDDPVETPAGVFDVMAEPRFNGRRLELHGMHMHGSGAHQLGVVRLRWLTQAVMEAMNLDEILICGAVRTTGARPGRRPGHLRFKRPPDPDAG